MGKPDDSIADLLPLVQRVLKIDDPQDGATPGLDWKSTLDTSIAELDQRIKQFQDERDRLAALQSQFEPSLSLLHTLPNEILEEIFLRTNADEPMLVSDTSEGPWLVSHVCQRWRSIALGSPKLWSSFAFSNEVAQYFVDPVALLKTALDRNSGTVGIEFEYESAHEDFRRLEEGVLDLLVKRSDDWVAATFVDVKEHAFHLDLSAARGHLCRLQRLVIERGLRFSPSRDHVSPFSSPVNLLRDASSLVEVKLSNVFLGDFIFEGGKITHFLSGPPLNAFSNGDAALATILTSCPRLVSLENTKPKPHPSSFFQNAIFTSYCLHTNLTELTTFDAALLEGLTTPNLSKLSVGHQDDPRVYGDSETYIFSCQIPVVLNFILRSQCSLRSLSLDTLDLDCDEFHKILDLNNRLEELFITFDGSLPDDANISINKAMSALARYLTLPITRADAPPTRSLPGLRLLHFTFSVFWRDDNKTYTFLNDEFVAMVFSRLAMATRPQPSRLQEIRMKFTCTYPMEAFSALSYTSVASLWQAVEEQGARIWIEGEHYNRKPPKILQLRKWTLV
jgi:hypothetical protein